MWRSWKADRARMRKVLATFTATAVLLGGVSGSSGQLNNTQGNAGYYPVYPDQVTANQAFANPNPVSYPIGYPGSAQTLPGLGNWSAVNQSPAMPGNDFRNESSLLEPGPSHRGLIPGNLNARQASQPSMPATASYPNQSYPNQTYPNQNPFGAMPAHQQPGQAAYGAQPNFPAQYPAAPNQPFAPSPMADGYGTLPIAPVPEPISPGYNEYQPGVFDDSSPYFNALQGGCGEQGCGSCGVSPCTCPPRRAWFGGIGGLVMARDFESNKYLSYYTGDPRSSILTSRTVEIGSMGGYQASIGRCLCNGWAWMGTYWGLAQTGDQYTATGYPDTRLTGMQYLNYTATGFGTNDLQTWFNGAIGHRVRRENEFHNIEINFFRGSLCDSNACATNQCFASGVGPGICGATNGCGRNWNVQWSAGARFFRFDEFFQYASSTIGGYTHEVRETYYDVETQNNLVGFQLGGVAQRAFGRCFTLYGGTKFGAYNNRVEHYQRVYGASGDAVINTGTYTNTAYNVRSRKDDLAVMCELDLGVRYHVGRCWRAAVGYRALAVSGVALAPDQIPNDFRYIPGVRYIDSDGSLLLHGVHASLEFRR